MLKVVEESGGSAGAVARHLAVQALRVLPVTRTEDWKLIKARLVRWVSVISVPREEDIARGEAHYAKGAEELLIQRIGVARPGERTVLGVHMTLRHGYAHVAATSVPAILEGHRLEVFDDLLFAAAVARSVYI